MIDDKMAAGAFDTDKNNSPKNKKNAKKEPKPKKPRELVIQRDINFFDNVKNDRKRNAKQSASKLNVICICGLAIIIGVLYFGLLKMNSDVKTSIKVTEKYINDPMVNIQLENVNSNKSDIEQIRSLTLSAKNTHDSMVVRPLINSKILESIIKCMPKTVSFTKVEYDNGVIILSCKSSTDLVAADFVNSLKKLNKFQSVTYEKVTRNIDTEVLTVGTTTQGSSSGAGAAGINLPSNVSGGANANLAANSNQNAGANANSNTGTNANSNTGANANSNTGTNANAGIGAGRTPNNSTVNVLQRMNTDSLVSVTATVYKYDYDIKIVFEDNSEVTANEVE